MEIFLKLKNKDWFLFMPLYTCIFMYGFHFGYVIKTQYMIY